MANKHMKKDAQHNQPKGKWNSKSQQDITLHAH